LALNTHLHLKKICAGLPLRLLILLLLLYLHLDLDLDLLTPELHPHLDLHLIFTLNLSSMKQTNQSPFSSMKQTKQSPLSSMKQTNQSPTGPGPPHLLLLFHLRNTNRMNSKETSKRRPGD
jgi:hypothetical protein